MRHSYSSLKVFETCPARYRYQYVTREFVDRGSEASQYGDRVHKQLEDRLRGAAALPAETARYEGLCRAVLAETGAAVYPEHKVALSRAFEPVDWWDEAAWLRGKLDVLAVHSTQAVVFDWKTGRRNLDFFQLQVFAALVFSAFPAVTQVTASFVWLKTDQIDTEKYSRSPHAHELWDEILRRVAQIERASANDKWPAMPSRMCRFCPARHACPSAA